MATRREVLAAAAATVSIPVLEKALGTVRSAHAAAPGTAPAGRAPAAASRVAADEKPGWFTTKIKPADVKDGEFTDVPDHAIALSRTGKEVTALTTKCTHNGCKIPPKAGEKELTCPCHGGKFKLDGSLGDPTKPPKTALANYAIRTSADGFVEIDPGQKPAKDAKEFKITLA